MALTRLGTDQLGDGIVTNAKISGSADIAGSKLEDDMTYGSNFTITGNLTVNGTTTTVDTTNMSIEDPLLVFSSGASGSGSVDAGFIVERGSDANVGFIWDESADAFVVINTTETGGTAGNVSIASNANFTAANIAGTLTTAAQTAITSIGTIATGVWEATDVGIAHGGTGASTAAAALSALGAGTEDSPQFTGIELGHATDTTITRPSGGDISVQGNIVYRAGGTDVPVTDGGTGSSTASGARTNLGLAIGSDVQAFDADLAELAALDQTDSNFIVANGSAWIVETGATARTSLGVAIGSDVQAFDADLAAIAGLTSAADKGIQFTGSGAAAVYNLTTAGKALLDDANNVAQLVTLGLSATAAELNIMDGVNSTTAELNIMDGGTAATGTTLVAADRVPVNDNGTMVQVALSDFETFMETNLDTLNAVTSATSLAAVGTITTGVWSGTAIVDAKVDNDLTISGGTVNASVIGGGTPAAGTFTTLTANDALVVNADVAIVGDTTGNVTLAVKGVGSQTANLMTVEISDGTDKFTVAADGSVAIAQDLVLASGATVNAILDQDNMSGNSATALATQQSIKAYVDNEVGSSVLTVGADSGSNDNVTVGTDTLDFSGGNNITTTVSDNDISIALDATVTGLTALTSGQLNADNITLDGNVISTTNTNGNLVLTPHGTGDVVISGDLQVDGTTTTVNSTVVTLDDPIMQLGGDTAPGSDDNKDRGVAFRWHTGAAAKNGWFGYDDSISKFTFVPDASITSEVVTGSAGNVIFGNIEGTITTAAQNSITSATGLTSVGAIGTGSWAATDVAVAHGGTGASDASTARTNLGVAIGSDVQAYDADLAAMAALAQSDGNFIVSNGSAWIVESGATARTSLGVGTGDSPQLTAVNVGHASDSTLARASAGDLAVEGNIIYRAGGTDVPVTDGGTGSSSASGARTNLGLVIGTNVQAYDADLAELAALDQTDGNFIVANGSAWIVETGATARASLSLTIGTHVQAYDADLAALAGLTSAADKGIQWTGSGAAATYDLTAAGKALLDDANATAQLVTLGITATAAEITAAIDGSTSATSTTLVAADRVPVNDNGTMVQVAMSDFETFMETNLDTLNAVTSASSLVTVGAIGTGSWAATDVAVAHGGTGSSTAAGAATNLGLGTGDSPQFTAVNVGHASDTTITRPSGGDISIEGNIVYRAGGTDVPVADGGTGASTLTANSLLTGNGTSAIVAEANITYDGTTFGVDDAAVFNNGGGDNDFRIASDNQANMFYVDASVDAIGLMTATPNAGTVLDMGGSTESLILPKGTTGQRPGTGVAGMFRYNSSDNTFEFYNGTSWKQATTEFTIVRTERLGSGGITAPNGVVTAFTGLNSSLTTAGCVVSINGVVQLPTTAYAIAGTTITFTEAPATGDVVEIREFTTTTSVNALTDADNDTKIQVEESADEDIIRFDTGGTERMTLTAAGHLVPTLDNTYDLGTSSLKWRNLYGTSTTAQYSDLAELYTADATYEPGTVVTFGGDAEITMSTETMDSRIAGVVSTAPAYLMNGDLENGTALALTGRVPVKVTGTIRKGDMLVSAGEGYAKAESNPRLGSVIGKALEDFDGTTGIIEVVVGRL